MREIVVISGKGGTGKTSLSAAFAYLEGENALICDCDVDAANMHLLLDATFDNQRDFYSGEVALIDEELCTNCGKCADVCRFDAIHIIDGQHRVDPISCEGCHYCSKVCKKNAIEMKIQKAGEIYTSDIKNNSKMVHAKLGFGAENSGKLVAKVKSDAKIVALQKNRDYVITDGSPGIGCPVISSLSGANLVVLVTEATVSGLHDLERVLKLVKNFSLQAVCIINKYDLNEKICKNIEYFLKKEGVELIGRLPYDETFTKSLSESKTIIEYDKNSKLSNLIKESWTKIKERVK
jgi:MinD superfamily P-loop ATPase